MEDGIQVISIAAEPTLESTEFGEQLLKHAQKAVRRLDVAECNRITKWAAENPNPAAGPALCTLLQRPRHLKGKQAWKRDTWVDMRVAAIKALRLTSDRFSAPTLANVLLHDVPVVRTEAQSALQALGASAVVPLLDRIRATTDWPLEGMLTAIETLGFIQDKSAGPTLARMLFGLLPRTPSRWFRAQLWWSMALGAVETACVLPYIAANFPGDGISTVLLIIPAAPLFVLFSVLSAIGVGFFIRSGKRAEARRLNAAASSALISIKDPRSVPSLVEVATEKYSQSARYGATRALQEVLPVLSADDYGLLNSAVERRLTSMFALHNPPLILAAVRSLEFVGTGQSAGPVERLTRRKAVASEAVFVQIRAEAQRVLPVLLDRKRLEEASSVLLRPSHAAPDTGAALLRPASSLTAYEEPVEHLLRPGSRE